MTLAAYWNTVTGNVWVAPVGASAPESNITVAREAVSELRAYDALTAAGFSRQANWLIVPGAPHLRSLDVTRTT